MSFSFRSLLVPFFACAVIAVACGDNDAISPSAQAESPNTAPFSSTAEDSISAGTVSDDPDREVQEGDTISVHYVGTLDDGSEFDSSRRPGRDALSFTVGAGQMIAGFDSAVRGMKLREVKTVRIEPADAYGERDETAVTNVPLDQLGPGVADTVEPGSILVSGSGQRVLVLEVSEEEIVIDLNSPLAGQALTFEIELIAFGN